MASHLERELALIQRRLARQEQQGDADDPLTLYARFLKMSENHIRTEHRCGGSGRTVARLRTQMMDVMLRHLWARSCRDQEQRGLVSLPPMAAVALGGYGRSELNPFSDVDLMFLQGTGNGAAMRAANEVVEKILYLLWDTGLKVGHSTRTVAQAIAAGNEDLQVKTSFIDARQVVGDAALFQEFQREVVKRCVQGKEADYIEWRLRDQKSRHDKQGGTVFMQEPNVKEGCGGLRDYHNLLWIAFFWKRIRTLGELAEHNVLARLEVKQIERAVDFLLRVRTQMHLLAKRENDQLALAIQGRVAAQLGYTQTPPVRRVEAFMRDYYAAAHDIFFLTNAAARRMAELTAAAKRTWFSFFPMRSSRAEHVDGFLVRGNEITFESKNVFGEEPGRLIGVFLLAQQRDLTLSHDLLRLIRRRLRLVTRSFIYLKKTREGLIELLSNKGQVARILRLMHQCGLLGKLVPEFAPLTCLVQHEFFHRYSADEHTLVCIEQLDRLASVEPVERATRYQNLFHSIDIPATLYLALLLHDTGKSSDAKHHAEASAMNAFRLARRMRLPPDTMKRLIFLVDHHMTMSEFAQRRNLDDVETIYEFARIVESRENLDLLMLLTFADGRGVSGGEGWSDWKEALMWNLYDQTRLLLENGPEFERKAEVKFHESIDEIAEACARVPKEEVAIHLACLPRRYIRAYSVDTIARHVSAVHEFYAEQLRMQGNPLKPVLAWTHYPDRGNSELLVVTWDRAQLVVRICGAISLAGLHIRSANVFTRDDNIVIDTFRVCTDMNAAVTDPRDQQAVESMLEKALLQESFDFEPLLKKTRTRRRPRHWTGGDFPTRLLIDNTFSNQFTLCEVQTPDRPALLHDLVKSLAETSTEIGFARIETEKGAAIDTFYVTDQAGKKITDSELLGRLKQHLLERTDGYLAGAAEAA